MKDRVEIAMAAVNKEHARSMAHVAARLAARDLSPTSAAVLLRTLAEGAMSRSGLDPDSLPPWPDDAPKRETWDEYATGKRK